MTCDARSPIHANPCRLEGLHPRHLAGYADQRESWPNRAYTPAPSAEATSKAEMNDLVRRIRAKPPL